MVLRVIADLVRHLPATIAERRRIQKIRKVPDKAVWDYSSVEDYNIFHYDNAIVLSLLNLRTAASGRQEYEVDGKMYSTMK